MLSISYPGVSTNHQTLSRAFLEHFPFPSFFLDFSPFVLVREKEGLFIRRSVIRPNKMSPAIKPSTAYCMKLYFT
jgi:hypothetical protein